MYWHTNNQLLSTFLRDFKSLLYHSPIDGLVQDCSNSISNALELPKSYDKPLIYMCVCVLNNIMPDHILIILVLNLDVNLDANLDPTLKHEITNEVLRNKADI